MRVFLYTRPLTYQQAKTEVRRQEEALQALAVLRGIQVSSEMWTPEPNVDSHSAFDAMVRTLEAGDVVLIGSPEVLGSTPSVLLERGQALVAKGAEVLVASTGGQELDLSAIRQYVRPFASLEKQITDLEAQIAEERREHKKEFEQYAKDFQAEIGRLLQLKGIGLSDLMRPAGQKPVQPKNASRGAALKEKRQALGLTQEEAGKLAKPAFNKVQVSRMEAEGRGEQIIEYEGWLTVEEQKRRKFGRGSVNLKPGNPNEPINLG